MLLAVVAIGSCVAGLAAGFLARAFLAAPVPILGDWLVLRYAENPGIAFGLRIPSPWQEILILGALAVVLAVALRSRTVVSRIGYGLILGGALANVLDRFVNGFVTDYVAVGSFPVFNLPDSCITVGVALLLVESAGIPQNIRRK